MSARFDRIESNQEQMGASIGHLESSVEQMGARFDRIESNQAHMGSRIGHLEGSMDQMSNRLSDVHKLLITLIVIGGGGLMTAVVGLALQLTRQ